MTATSPLMSESAPTKRWMVAGFVCATIFSAAVTLGVGVYTSDHQAHVADRLTQVNRFVDTSQQMDQLVAAAVPEIRRGHITAPTREALRSNLRLQRGHLEGLNGRLSSREAELAADYTAALLRLDEGVKEAKGPLQSREFAQAAADIAGIRPDLIVELKS